jgi:hypothetical protein
MFEPPRAFPRLVPRSHASPKAASESAPSSRCASAGKHPTDRRTVRRPHCQALSPRPARAPRCAPSVPWSLACAWVTYKRGRYPPPRARPLCRSLGRPPAPWPPRRRSCHLRPAAHQTKVASALPCPYSSPRNLPSRRRDLLAGTPVAAATAAGRRCTPRRQTHQLPNPTQIGPYHSLDPTPPAPGWPRPAVGRNLAGPPLAGRPGTTLRRKESFQGPHCERVTQIVKVLWLFFCKLCRTS